MQKFSYKGVEIAYVDEGSGEALLYIHEWNGSSQVFVRANLPILKRDFRVVAFDLPGFGKSGQIEGFVYGEIERLISALMDHLGLDQFHIMGFCLGSSMALDYYLHNPKRIKSLILMDIALTFPIIMRLMNLPIIGRLLYKIFSRTKSGFSAFLMFVNNRVLIGNADLFESIQQTTYANARLYINSVRKELATFTKSVAEQTHHPPCLVITSDNTLRLFYKDSHTMHRIWQESKLIVMKNCGHYIQLQKPKSLCEHVKSFIESNA
ncbi:MAG: alpha/beta hydrolase [Candidatus Cloacimonadaceae bacterium]|nr:alpha/beta hydrolase [Candidatus Cloacimonadaceae bacterium]MDP3113209.1 alpha/beta hydrolase [Candidatus Cloacimonadaceae bacterium]